MLPLFLFIIGTIALALASAISDYRKRGAV